MRVVDAERRTDQVIDEIDLGAGEIADRDLIDQHGRAVATNDEIVGRLPAVDVEFVLETRAAAALHADAKHAACRLATQNLADAACGPFGEGNIVHPRTNDLPVGLTDS